MMSDLERRLGSLDSAELFPAAPDIAATVERQLRERSIEQPDQRAGRRAPRLRAHPALTAILAGLLAFAALFATSPGARSAMLELLGLEGARIERGEPSTRRAAPLPLGREVTLGEARRRAGFEVVLPRLAALGAPSRIGFSAHPRPEGQVIFAWDGAPGLTNRPAADMALVLAQFAATGEPILGKTAPRNTRIEPVRIGGEPGYWLTGAHHQFSYLTREGVLRPDTTRLAGDTLLWEHDGLLLRLEGAASKQAALEIARSIP